MEIKVQSQTNPDTVYTVKRGKKGQLTCECMAYRFTRIDEATGVKAPCKHIRQVVSLVTVKQSA